MRWYPACCRAPGKRVCTCRKMQTKLDYREASSCFTPPASLSPPAFFPFVFIYFPEQIIDTCPDQAERFVFTPPADFSSSVCQKSLQDAYSNKTRLFLVVQRIWGQQVARYLCLPEEKQPLSGHLVRCCSCLASLPFIIRTRLLFGPGKYPWGFTPPATQASARLLRERGFSLFIHTRS